jgi:phospholipid/cholesterol/gamma-HCH transport system substrate-binding protein
MAVESNLELKVGVFVIIALILLGIFVFLISDISFFKPGWNIKLIFGFADGVKVAAPVRVAGVDMGKVKEIKMFYDTEEKKTVIEILAWLKSDAKVPVDSKAWVNQLGLLGEKYVEIIPGENYTSYLKDGDQLVGDDSISMRELGELGRKIAAKLDESIAGFNEVLKDEKTRTSLKDLLANLAGTTESLNVIFAKIKNGEGTVGKLLYEDAIYKDLEGLTSDLRKNPWKLLRK